VLTDKKTKLVKLDFYNNDITTKFRIVVEGVNAAGKITRIEKIIQ
jgi:polyphosphate kinase 2 (PPK2 family)